MINAPRTLKDSLGQAFYTAMTFFTRRGENGDSADGSTQMYSTRRDRKWENSVKKIGRVLSAQRRTERLSYWILLAMLGLSSSICPNHFHDLTARRFRFRSCVKRSRTSKRPIGFASQIAVRFFSFCSFVSQAQFILHQNRFLLHISSNTEKN